MGSSLEVGSSATKSVGRVSKARRIAKRCNSPPET
ncbi:Protein of uncharacterised function (DUF1602) [Vibrio cholerae]|nr:Protein of uncharacterised function (DUF1602) [Vibrio cholerae]